MYGTTGLEPATSAVTDRGGSNLLKLRVIDGFFWRSEIPSVTVIGPLIEPPTSAQTFASVSCTGENGEQNWDS